MWLLAPFEQLAYVIGIEVDTLSSAGDNQCGSVHLQTLRKRNCE